MVGATASGAALIAGRSLQGVGAAGMLPLGLATIGAVAAGPVLGGVVAEHVGRRSVLGLGVPMALAALGLIAAGRLPAAGAGARKWIGSVQGF